MTADELLTQLDALDEQLRDLLMARGQALVALSRADYGRYCMETRKARTAMRAQEKAGLAKGPYRAADLAAMLETVFAGQPFSVKEKGSF